MVGHEHESINHDVPYKIIYNGVLIGFCLHHMAYITNPELANIYDASVLFYNVDNLNMDELELIKVTDQKCIDAAYATEKICNVKKFQNGCENND